MKYVSCLCLVFISGMRKFFSSHLFQWTIIFLIIAAISLWLSRYIGQSQISAWMDGNVRAPWIYILLKSVTVVFAPLSGTTLYVIAPVLRWPWEALLYTVVGNALWISVSYRLWMRYADQVVRWLFGKKWLLQAHAIVDKISTYWKFLVVRTVFFFLEDLINYTAWMARVPFWWFFLVSMSWTTVVFGLFVFGFDWVQNIL